MVLTAKANSFSVKRQTGAITDLLSAVDAPGKICAAVLLAIQVLSEASYHSQAYRPISTDWANQQAVKRWYRQLNIESAIADLIALLNGCRRS
ncbi:hypothetical protein AAULR_10655 [Lacticaseibacillus rhamnosus MTCC 5462]|nr:hypothetical protein AAULR_10655 [Lacticaseibacillus rhamnosus MTCC 5462]